MLSKPYKILIPAKQTFPVATGLRPGLTLVELMVTIGLGMLLTTFALMMLKTSSQAYMVQDDILEQQQNLRAALYNVARDVRAAGSGFGLLGSSVKRIRAFADGAWYYNGQDNKLGVVPISGTDGGTSGADSIEVFSAHPVSGIPQANLAAAANFNGGASVLNTTNAVNDNNFGLRDFAVVTDGSTAQMFQVTAVPSGNAISTSTAGSPHNPPSGAPEPHTYPANADIYNFGSVRWATYSIDTTTDSQHPSLVVNLHDGKGSRVIASDIDDLQVRYYTGLFEPDGITKKYLNGFPQIPPQSLSEADLTNGKISEVRIMLTGRTANKDMRGAKSSPPAQIFNRTRSGEAPYRWRTLSMDIRLRNSSY